MRNTSGINATQGLPSGADTSVVASGNALSAGLGQHLDRAAVVPAAEA